MNTLTIGCDPELFLQDAAGGLKSAIGLIGGTKEQPMPVIELGKGFAVQEDNVAVEYNVPPSSTALEFSTNVGQMMAYLEGFVQANYGLQFSKLSAAVFPASELKAPGAMVFGCDPDFDAWTGKQNPRPRAKNKALRSGGGHVHVGYTFDSIDDKLRQIRCMDLTMGVGSVLMDKDSTRRELYGKRGAFRDKVYGVEYRTLSNFWVMRPELCSWVFENTQRALDLNLNGFNIDALDDDIRVAINEGNTDVAQRLVTQYNLQLA